MKIDIAGVLVDTVTKKETINEIERLARGESGNLIVTTYSEFIVFADRDPEYKKVLNSATLSLPDGVGILWAAKYLSLRASNKIQALWQIVYTGASLIFNPNYCRSIIFETVTGSRLVWDIAELAARQKFSLALVGGINGVAPKAAKALQTKFPGLKINLAVSDEQFDSVMIERIAASGSDILLIAYQPPRQEKWLADNLSKLNVKVAMGLGGTLDYLAGKRAPAPKFVSFLGLEWLWRLITQPWRVKRIWNAIIVFISIVYRYKIKQLL